MIVPVVLMIAFVLVISFLPKYLRYTASDYKNVSGNNFAKTIFDTGNYGEFLTFSYLEKLSGYKKILTNVYIPYEGGATEIDLILLQETGIYVLESKNYSGWIFGSEKNKTWTQSLPNKQKNHFYNPIWQNRTHIKALSNYLPAFDKKIFKSYIIFSERCQLKKINLTSSDIKVINRQHLLRTLKQDISISAVALTREEIDRIYGELQAYTKVDEQMKKEHIENIRAKGLI